MEVYHIMKCPVDGVDLVMTERQGVEIDYCPQCRGIWLDRGELDKIIERSAQHEAQYTRPVAANDYSADEKKKRSFDMDDDKHDYRRDDDDHDSYPRGRKKRSFLGDMFDIFD